MYDGQWFSPLRKALSAFVTAISLKIQNNNDAKSKFCVLHGLLHHNYTIL